MYLQYCSWYRPGNRHIEDDTTAERRGQGEMLGSGQRFSWGVTGSHGGVRAEESGPVCLLCKGLGW